MPIGNRLAASPLVPVYQNVLCPLRNVMLQIGFCLEQPCRPQVIEILLLPRVRICLDTLLVQAFQQSIAMRFKTLGVGRKSLIRHDRSVVMVITVLSIAPEGLRGGSDGSEQRDES